MSLRVLRVVAETGSFTAAAQALGYTQSAISRQIAVLEASAGAALFQRRASGVVPTAAGRTLLTYASAALEQVDRAEQILHGAPPAGATVRLGVFSGVGAALLPLALAHLGRTHGEVDVVSREGSTPALVRSVRVSTLDLAVVASQPPYPPPDELRPSLETQVLLEGELRVAVAAASPLGRSGEVSLAELEDQQWIASPSTGAEPGLGVWPALARRPLVAHQARDWLTKLALVDAGLGLTTVPPALVTLVPAGVRLARVVDGPAVTRRAVLVRLPGRGSPAVEALAGSLRESAAHLPLG